MGFIYCFGFALSLRDGGRFVFAVGPGARKGSAMGLLAMVFAVARKEHSEYGKDQRFMVVLIAAWAYGPIIFLWLRS